MTKIFYVRNYPVRVKKTEFSITWFIYFHAEILKYIYKVFCVECFC
jgi:hypothetical protein